MLLRNNFVEVDVAGHELQCLSLNSRCFAIKAVARVVAVLPLYHLVADLGIEFMLPLLLVGPGGMYPAAQEYGPPYGSFNRLRSFR